MTGSREPNPQAVSALSGFDPARNNPLDYFAGWNAAIEQCAAIAERWRDQNKEARARALKQGRKRFDFLGDETLLVEAEALHGAEIECNAIAGEIRRHAIATEAQRAETGNTDSVHEGAGRKASPKPDGQSTLEQEKRP